MTLLKLADRLAVIGLILLWANTVLFLLLGLLAALLGGAWTHLGEGLGGAWGIPGLIFDLTILMGVPSLVVGVRGVFSKQWRKAARLVAFFGPVLISLGFILIAHSVDPCTHGVWKPWTFWGDQSLCERFGHDVNIHTRFHLLLHIAPMVLVMGAYHYALGRLYRLNLHRG